MSRKSLTHLCRMNRQSNNAKRADLLTVDQLSTWQNRDLSTEPWHRERGSKMTLRGRLLLVLVGAIFHCLVLIALALGYVVLMGISFTITHAFVLAFLSANALCVSEIIAQQSGAQSMDRIPVNRNVRFLCYAEAMTVLTIVVVSLADSMLVTGPFGFLQVSGLVLLVIGVLLRTRSIVVLNGQFISEVKRSDSSNNAANLVTHDVYSLIRHPGEVGLLIACLGILLIAQCPPAAFVWALVMLPVILCRIVAEEKQLRKMPNNIYGHYAQQVNAVVPIKVLGRLFFLSKRLLCVSTTKPSESTAPPMS